MNKHLIIHDYHIWRNQAPLSDPKWEPQFSEGLAPVGCLLWIRMPDSTPLLCRRTGHVARVYKVGRKHDTPEYKIEATGELIVGDFAWCIY